MGQQDLLVEGDADVRPVAPVRDLVRPDPDPVPARARGNAGRRLDLGRDDLDRPDPVAHLRAHGPEDLAALLRALAGIGHDFHGMLAGPDHRDAALLGLRLGGRLRHRGVHRHVGFLVFRSPAGFRARRLRPRSPGRPSGAWRKEPTGLVHLLCQIGPRCVTPITCSLAYVCAAVEPGCSSRGPEVGQCNSRCASGHGGRPPGRSIRRRAGELDRPGRAGRQSSGGGSSTPMNGRARKRSS